jgi:arylsulfatase A-like enzyme
LFLITLARIEMIRRLGRGMVFWLAAALLAAALHLAIVQVRHRVLGQFDWLWKARDVAVMLPLGYLAVMVIPLLAAAAAHAVFPRRVGLAAVGAFAMGWVALGVLLLFQRISPWGWVVVALGVAVQWYRYWRGREEAHWRLARWTAAAGAVLFAALGVMRQWSASSSEQRAMASLPPVVVDSGTAPPNVLLLIWDTVRASSLSVYGDTARTTPGLGAMAERGVVFEEAFSTAPWTLPSHAAMFTGLNGSLQSSDWKFPLDETPPVLAEQLRSRGYVTGGFVANLSATGFATGLGRGFVRYEDTKRTVDEVLLSSTFGQRTPIETFVNWRSEGLRQAVRQAVSRASWHNSSYQTHDQKPASEVAEQFLDWESGIAGRPWFAFLNLFDAHAPYRPPMQYRQMFDRTGRVYGRYLGSIRYIDDVMAMLVAELDRRGRLANTIVVVTSDHGEQFGEHGLNAHGNSLYREVLRVPLLIMAPGRAPSGVRVSSAVSLRDVSATILDLAGVPQGAIAGRSLRGLWASPPNAKPSDVIAEVTKGINDARGNPTAEGDLRAVIDDTLTVIRNTTSKLEAFAYRADPTESTNLASDPARVPALLKHFYAALRRAGIP